MGECFICGKTVSDGYSVNKSVFTFCPKCLNKETEILQSMMDDSPDLNTVIDKYRDTAPNQQLYDSAIAYMYEHYSPTGKTQVEEQEKKSHEAENKAIEEASKILITSGFNFDGYKVVKYSGYISGDDATEIPRSDIYVHHTGLQLTDALVKIRRQALKELKLAAYELGCNAVIGVDFDYITLEPETTNLRGGTHYEPYVICVTANGNAVVIEKEE